MRDNSIETLFPKCTASINGGTLTTTIPNRYQKKTVSTNVGVALLYDTTIDLSAFFVQNRTFYPYELVTQNIGRADCSTPAQWNNAASIIVYDIITSVPINGQLLVDSIVNQNYPGMPEFALDNQFIMYGCLKVYAANSTNSFPGYMTLVQSNNFGSGKPTAAEQLYCYRVIIPDSDAAVTTGTFVLPGTRYEFLGKTNVEDELGRIYRLRQSYEQVERV